MQNSVGRTTFETFYDLYMYICSCFEVIVDPNVYSDMNIDTNWEWDSESRAKAQGLLYALKDPQIFIVYFLLSPNMCLRLLNLLLSSCKKKMKILYMLIHSVINDIKCFRGKFEKEFHDWFMDANRIGCELGIVLAVPRLTGRQRHRSRKSRS